MKKTHLLTSLFGIGASLALVGQDNPSNQDSSTPQPNLDRSQLPTPPAAVERAEGSAVEKAEGENNTRPGDTRPGEADADTATDRGMNPGDMHRKLVAVLSPTEGNEARGVVIFESKGNEGVQVTANLTGLEPNSKHAIHVHEFGDISSPDGTSAGSHFNPMDKKHGLPGDDEHHPGDFGNLEADEKGNAMMTLTATGLSLSGDSSAIIGRAVIVHADEDKGTQPTGDAGARIAQGVIAVANPGAAGAPGSEPGTAPAPGADNTDRTSARPAVVSAPADRDPGVADDIEEVAGEIGRGAERAARKTVRALERGAEEVGDALKDVGREVEKAVD